MSDERIQRLERELTIDSSNVDLQHALVRERVRVGDYLPIALEYLLEGKPVLPWQFNAISYVFLEAERLGRETGYQEGRVEAIYRPGVVNANGMVPMWGLDQAPDFDGWGNPTFAPALRRFYVKTASLWLQGMGALGGFSEEELHELPSRLRYLPGDRPAYSLEVTRRFVPPRHVPALHLIEGCRYEYMHKGKLSPEDSASIPRFFLEEFEGRTYYAGRDRYDCRHARMPYNPLLRREFAGRFPELHMPQRVLAAVRRPGGYVDNSSIFLDVRMFEAARIMKRVGKGRRWKNNPWRRSHR